MSDSASNTAATGRSWIPPKVSGPLITFRGRNPDVSEVEREARAALEAGYQRGYSEGLAAANSEVDAHLRRLDEQIQAFALIGRQLGRPLERLDEVAASELARLATMIGSQLARRALVQDPAAIVAVIRDCLAELPASSREVRLHLHPLDAVSARDGLGGVSPESGWTIVEDATISRGGVRVMVDASSIDATFENRLATAVAAILGDSRTSVSRDLTAEIEAEGGLA